ncbi:MAG: 3-oxoacyl-ACP synthase [Rhodospirillaceae bacterium]|nr:3-oxoacyl-ACP synthase [Rhodospirillaceae bacterium]|tara:strand:+ start:1702 stop:2676 length:975 start_codon:yes stop_codon:yes gene_type:complete
MIRRSIVVGCGCYLPQRVVTNEELARSIDTSDEWVRKRTGIVERRIADENEKTSDLAINAAKEAIKTAGLSVNDIDLIVLATATPDETFPATATRVQEGLGMTKGAAFDVQAVCTGFIYALNIADNFIRVGQAETVMVIGAETFSRILDWDDRTTSVLFGDGAGAIIIQGLEQSSDKNLRGILSNHLHSDGRHHDFLYVDGGPSSTKTVGHLRMEGREVFRHAIKNMASVLEEALEANNLSPEDIDWLVPHQANKRIIDGTAQKLKLAPEKVIVTVDRHANTSAASIPLALGTALNDGLIKEQDIVVLEAMGGGFTWGASLIRW